MILDTSLLIEAERGNVHITALLDSLGDETVAMASITGSELLHGCHRATNAGIRARRFAFVEALLETIPAAPFGLVEARRHAELWADLLSRGKIIGPHDLLIAATAQARGDRLATLNQQEFKRVPGLGLIKMSSFLKRRGG